MRRLGLRRRLAYERYGSTVRGLRGTLGTLAVLLALAAPASAAPGFRVGYGRVDVTPPVGTAPAPSAFAGCAPVYTGPRAFAFDEPYTDVHGNGRYGSGPPAEPYCDANNN